MLDEIMLSDVPRVFQLGYRDKRIICELHIDALPWLRKLDSKNPYIKDMRRRFPFTSFTNDQYSRNFGFNNCFEVIKENDNNNIVIFQAKIPVKYSRSGPCTYCNGIGEGFSDDQPCIRCNGTKYEWKLNENPVGEALSASLQLLCMTGSIVPLSQERNRIQLIDIDLTTDIRAYGGNIYGHISKEITAWVASHKKDFQKVIVQPVFLAMKDALSIIAPHWLSQANHFEIKINEKGWVTIGYASRCSIYPSLDNKEEASGGYIIECHNVDTSTEQIILVVALAKLCDLYDEEHKKAPK